MPLDLDLPDKEFKINMKLAGTFIALLMFISFAFGGYKSGFYAQQDEISKIKADIVSLRVELQNDRVAIQQLTDSINFLNQRNNEQDNRIQDDAQAYIKSGKHK